MQRPILIVVIGYIIGIIIGLYCKISIALLCIGLIFVSLLIHKYISLKRNIKKYYTILINKTSCIIFMTSIIIGCAITVYKNNSYENKYTNIEKNDFIAIVVNGVKQGEYYNQYKVKVISIDKDKKYNNTYLLLNLKKDIILEYGDKIEFYGEYKKPDVQRNYKGFSYKEYLKSIGIHGSVKANEVNKLGKDNINVIIKTANNLRKYIKTNIEENMENEEKRNLLLGILLGDDSNLSDDIKEQFSNSGLSHILAVSGMHVSYIIMGINTLLKKTKLPKKITSIIIIVFLIFFIFLTGGTPSVKRACIMTILSLGASITYRKNDVISNISMALLIILIQNPFSILDIGLVLSFLATIGIVSLNFLKNNKEEELRENLNKELILKEKIIKKVYLTIKEIIRNINICTNFYFTNYYNRI